jgi:uncharacterized protein with HEPN domain
VPSSNKRLTFGDIIENIDRIREYTAGMSEADFAADRRTVDATERCLGRISEAAVKLGDEAPRLAPNLPWSDIRGLGNHLRHGYRGVQPKVIWAIVTDDLGPLRDGSIAALAALHDETG